MGRQVLVVDDDADMRAALCDILVSEGYESGEAGDGSSALAWLRTHEIPSLVLLDWNMAPMNAPEFVAALRQDAKFADLPVVLLTADSRVEPRPRLSGTVGYLPKPIDIDELFRWVNRYVN